MSAHSLCWSHDRAAPLPLDERRAALIAATEPLLEHFGRDVSTRQIAEAAGIAEGTIFRAFATKEALIDAVLEDAFDSRRTCDELARSIRTLGLEEPLVAAVTLLQERLAQGLRPVPLAAATRSCPDHDSFRAEAAGRHRTDNSADRCADRA